jgi:hypothetical protein
MGKILDVLRNRWKATAGGARELEESNAQEVEVVLQQKNKGAPQSRGK